MFHTEFTPDRFNARPTKDLPRLLGIELVTVTERNIVGRMPVRSDLLAPHGYLHGASVIALADTMAGCGTLANLPEDAVSFTTIELKSNFLGTARAGVIVCAATPVHLGRNTQVWDAVVTDEKSGKQIALFRLLRCSCARLESALKTAVAFDTASLMNRFQ